MTELTAWGVKLTGAWNPTIQFQLVKQVKQIEKCSVERNISGACALLLLPLFINIFKSGKTRPTIGSVFRVWGSALQDRRSRFRFQIPSLEFLIDKPSSRILPLRSTQPLTEMSTRGILLGGKGNLRLGLN